ncbi:MAG: tripartite tricarboxylate transporter TctB family protein [Hyphomicrobiales bacterium]|nr:tripartite tricarboxylate transporter TctB family protein [Hyphomicrobiales bacterium]
MRFNDAVLGGALLVFSIVIGLWSQSFPAIPGQEYGAAVFPATVATGMGLCSLVLIVSGLRQKGVALAFAGWAQDWRGFVRILVVIASVVFYIAAAKPLGFIPTMTLVLLANLKQLGVGWLQSIVIAIAISLLIQWSFGDLLHVPLPWGILSAYRF